MGNGTVEARKFFGTDGIRGTWGGPTINECFFRRLGRALGHDLEKQGNGAGPIVLGRDGRDSGPALQSALVGGLPAGVEVLDVGVLSSPAIALSTVAFGAALGLSLTASHNPPGDNGVKFFDGQGRKWPREKELLLENLLEDSPWDCGTDFSGGGTVRECHGEALERYGKAWKRALEGEGRLAGLRLVLDMANGATAAYGKELLESLGAEVIAVGDGTDGRGINGGCGSEWPDFLAGRVRETGSDWGLALDGDGDRALLCDGRGRVLPGEHLLARLALHLKETGRLEPAALVTTVQANGALDGQLAGRGIAVLRSDVGDRNVAECMERRGCALGGEPSGHVIWRDFAPVADGLLTGALFLSSFRGKWLGEENSDDWRFPLRPWAAENVPLVKKFPLEEARHLSEKMSAVKKILGPAGSVLVRHSGTEMRLRLRVEAETEEEAARHLRSLVEAFSLDVGENSERK
jgi:phosphoglucosamine mutase